MKWKLFILGLLLISTGQLFADPFMAESGLSGSVTDSISGEPLPFASVQLIAPNDPQITYGVITDVNGQFKIRNIKTGQYKLIASYMGYDSYEAIISFGDRKEKLDIHLSQKQFSLDEIEVKTEKSAVENTIEKTTVNVFKNSTVTGGTALEVMQTLPSVDIDINGVIQYRGSDRVTILINGQPSELVKSLDQFPADQIEKIELINNPSAKYDAEGMSGIINIVLKSGNKGKNKASVMLQAGLPEIFGGNAGYSGVREKSNFFINAGLNHKMKFQTKEHLRENYEDPDSYDYYQYDYQDENLNNAIFNANYELNINKKQQLGLSVVGSSKFNTADRSIQYKTLGDNGETVFESDKDIDISLDNLSFDANSNYRFKIDEDGQQLDASVHYSFLDQMQEMQNVYYYEMNIENPELQNTYSKQYNSKYNFIELSCMSGCSI